MRFVLLILRELAYRKLNFACGLLSVSIAVACLAAELEFLRRHDAETERLLAAKEEATKKQMAALEDDYRKITLGLGFNVLILPRDQNLSDLYAEDYARQTMPEEYVQRLARSRIATIQHLLPTLQQKLKWPELDRTIILAGVRGEVPILQANRKKPIQEAVPAGTIVLGSELHQSLKLKVGDRLRLLGHEFTVSKLHPERGTKDDITAWINLKEAQALLDLPGRINGILALECVCAAESLGKVRSEIGRVLPETQVIEFQSQMLARAEARQRAAAEAKEALEAERRHRAQLRETQARLASLAVPLVFLGAACWIGFLSLANARERRGEIGILRALGLSSGQLLAILLGRALLMGLGGAILGSAAGLLMGTFWPTRAVHSTWATADMRACLLILVGASMLAIVATWLPAWTAARQDPARLLQDQ
jgi:putative ABC transport system permease protein